jgi:hypothetical protein
MFGFRLRHIQQRGNHRARELLHTRLHDFLLQPVCLQFLETALLLPPRQGREEFSRGRQPAERAGRTMGSRGAAAEFADISPPCRNQKLSDYFRWLRLVMTSTAATRLRRWRWPGARLK